MAEVRIQTWVQGLWTDDGQVAVYQSATTVVPPVKPNRSRPVYVYLVEFTVPDGKQPPWCPPGWQGANWRWPKKKRCLTYGTAMRWAGHMESLGAVDVRVRRSKPVEWDA